MKNFKKLLSIMLFFTLVLIFNSECANAAWKNDSLGWKNYENNSYSIGWRNINNNWYYFGQDGYMKTNWQLISGNWYYLQSSGEMKTGWQLADGNWYYLQSNGIMKTGWHLVNGEWYYLQSNGVMKTGWIKDNGVWYYLNNSGIMQTEAIKINGKINKFNSNGVWLGEEAQNDVNIKVHYINVGQGDSELIQIDDKNILIDAGDNNNKSYNYLKSLGIIKLDYIIVTHMHEDHIGGMDEILNSLTVNKLYAPQVTNNTTAFENMINAAKNKGLKITVPKVGEELSIGNATLTFLAPNSEKYEDANNYSIVCKLKYGNNSFLFDGDAEELSESEILAKQLDIQADVIKIGHHGSTSSTTKAFLDKVNPQYAIISVGEENDYGHPADATLNKLNAKGIKTFRTDTNGTIIATSNGSNITFNTNPVVSKAETTSVITDTTKINATSVNTNEVQQNVWIANSNSKVYHNSKTCSNMKNPIQITLKEAQQKGLKPCSKCVN